MTCPSCAHRNRAQAKFCEECGARLASAEPGAPGPHRARGYTPRHLADRILRSRSALEGEHKQVTVLFADVKGSMALAEEVDAEDWHRILDRFFAILGEGVHRFEGTINQYTGDGIMALFGAPIAHEDHARRACYAALALRGELREYAEELRRARGLNFSVRMGLNSGEVVVGRIGDDLRMDYTAQGHTVGLAQRMEQLAAPGSAYLTEATARQAEGFVTLRNLGEFEIRGLARPVKAFELEDVGKLRTRFDLSRTRGLSIFVGRDGEMAVLEEKLDRALAGEAQIVSIVGEAGVGKSRLSFEFLERCRAREIRVATGNAESHGRSVPLLPWLSIFRSSFDVDERDDPTAAREKIAGRAVLWEPTLSDLLPFVFDFMGITDPSAPTLEMDPDARRRKLLEFVCRASEARNRQQGGVLLWEDLHWLDPASDQMLADWLEAVADTRTLVLTNYRPEYGAAWSRWKNHTSIRLAPLRSTDVRTLLADLLGDDPTVFALPRMIEERTRGNPFFIEEVVQSLIERGDLRGKRGAYALTTALRALEIPGSVRAVLAARIDRLGDEEKSLLQTAAVLGKAFEEPVLEKTTGRPRSRLAAPLASLQTAEMIFEDALYPVRRFAFKHPLTQEVAYHSQLQDGRARTHRKAARALADLHPDTLDEKAALIAEHFEQGGEPLEAARFHARAAVWVGTRDIPESLRHDRRAIELLARAAETRETRTLGVHARARLLHLAWRAGMEAAEEDRLHAEGTALAEALTDERERARVAIPYGACLAMRGDERGRERLARETYDRAMSLADPELALMALVPLTTSLLQTAQHADALGVFVRHERDLAPASERQGFWEFSARAYLLGNRGVLLARLGRMAGALGDAQAALERALRDGRRESEMVAHQMASEIHASTGDARAMLEHSERFLDLAELHGAPAYICLAHACMTRGRTLTGDPEAGIEHARQAEDTIVAYGIEGFRPFLGSVRAQAQLRVDPPAAAETARQTIDLARENGFVIDLVRCLLLLAATSDPVEALPLLEEARSIVETSGWQGERPLVAEAEGAVATRRGDQATARARYEDASREWSRMGAVHHGRRLEAILSGL